MKKLLLAATVFCVSILGHARSEAQPRKSIIEQDFICVMGGVRKPCVCYFPKGTHMTFAQAFRLAGEFREGSPQGMTFIYLKGNNTGYRYSLGRSQLLADKTPLQNGDVIYVSQPARPPWRTGPRRIDPNPTPIPNPAKY